MTELIPAPAPGIPDYTVSSTDRLREGFYLFAKAPGVLIAYFIIGWVVVYLVSLVPFLGSIAGFILTILHSAGFYVLFHKLHEKGTVKIEECFEAVDFLGQATLGSIIGGALIILGYILLVLPGIYLTVAYTLFMPFLLFERLNGWDALERSRKVINRNFWGVLWFVILCLIVNFLGALALGIGLLVTMPTTLGATYLLYRHIKRQIG